MDELGQWAADRHVSKSLGAQWRRFWAGVGLFLLDLPNFIRSNMGISILVGGSVAIYIWETSNSTLGYNRLFPSRVGYTWIVALGSTCAYLYFHRKSAELVRGAKDLKDILIALSQGVLALMAACVCLYGTFSQLVGDSMATNDGALQAQHIRQVKIDAKDKAERVLYNLPRPTTDQALLEDMQDRLNEAAGWTDPVTKQPYTNLDGVEGGVCASQAGLSPRMKFLCRDASDIRQKQLENEGQWQAIRDQESLIESLETEIANIQDVDKVMHYQAMERMTSGKFSQEDFAIWGLFILTIFIWFIGGFMFDDAMESNQARKAREEKLKAKKAEGTT